MQIPPAVESENDITKAIFSPVILYQRPPNTAPNISAAADAKAFIKMSPGKNRSEKLN